MSDPRVYNNGGSYNQEQPSYKSSGSVINYFKIFGFMFIGLLITAAITVLGGYLFNKYLFNNSGAMLGIVIAACIAQITLSIVISVVFAKGKHSITIPGILYCITMGFLCATLSTYISWEIMGLAFGITCGMFGVMALCSLLVKPEKSAIPVVVLGLLIGLGILSLINLFLIPAFARSRPDIPLGVFWAVDLGIFAVLMFVTIYDIAQIRAIANRCQGDNNLMMYCAFVIYTDFIAIFIKVCYYLAIIFGKSR